MERWRNGRRPERSLSSRVVEPVQYVCVCQSSLLCVAWAIDDSNMTEMNRLDAVNYTAQKDTTWSKEEWTEACPKNSVSRCAALA